MNTATIGQTRAVPLIKVDLPPFEMVESHLREMFTSGRITNFGPHVIDFEEKSATYLGSGVATVSSGTMALIFALQALGLERGQKVIVPSFTFVATAQAILFAGGIPVFAEVLDDLTLDPADLQDLLERHSDVGAVIGVHMYGLPCHIDDIQGAVEGATGGRGRQIPLVYDAAHAFGSVLNGRRIGTFGDAEVFSLSVTKALCSVEGGMVSSRNPDVIRRVRKMRNYGIEENYNAHYLGLNGKMSEFHALVGLYNLARLDGYLAARQGNAAYYGQQIRLATKFDLVPGRPGAINTFKDFTVLTPVVLEGRRDQVIAHLKARGVETRAYFFPPVHEQAFFARFSDRRLPRTEAFARRVITLPFYTSITRSEMDYVVDALTEAERRLG